MVDFINLEKHNFKYLKLELICILINSIEFFSN